jgi:hypothetical protein
VLEYLDKNLGLLGELAREHDLEAAMIGVGETTR